MLNDTFKGSFYGSSKKNEAEKLSDKDVKKYHDKSSNVLKRSLGDVFVFGKFHGSSQNNQPTKSVISNISKSALNEIFTNGRFHSSQISNNEDTIKVTQNKTRLTAKTFIEETNKVLPGISKFTMYYNKTMLDEFLGSNPSIGIPKTMSDFYFFEEQFEQHCKQEGLDTEGDSSPKK